MKKVHNFLKRPLPEKKLLVKALLYVWGVKSGLRLLPFRTMLTLIKRVPINSGPTSVALNQLLGAMDTAGRNVPRATCLVRAMAGQAFLARYGHETDLRIGVLKDQSEKRVKAHAWLESRGLVLLGETVKPYTAFPTLGDQGFRER
ncbi:MAG: lasso peptide biosynthesis B2 protein [Desulfobacteraceae bacterium]|nr:MAG: lasso peptide biosynthesis B2 protein [Desulfobacteraceae bacterium]